MSKIGAGHVAAMARLGLKEIRNAVNPSKESVADNEIGVFGSLTQGEISKGRDGPGAGPEQESPNAKLTLDGMRGEAMQKSKDDDQGKDRERERERDQGPER